jgi:beta-galactosidase
VSPNAVILGVGNGDPSCHEPDKATGRSAFGGLARVIVQSIHGEWGNAISLVAESDGLLSAKIPIYPVQP